MLHTEPLSRGNYDSRPSEVFYFRGIIHNINHELPFQTSGGVLTMSLICRRGLTTLIPPKIASPSGLGAAQDAARMRRIVGFYEKLPRGPAPEFKPKGLFQRYGHAYFWGKNSSKTPIIHFIAVMTVFGYAWRYHFQIRHHKHNAH